MGECESQLLLFNPVSWRMVPVVPRVMGWYPPTVSCFFEDGKQLCIHVVFISLDFDVMLGV